MSGELPNPDEHSENIVRNFLDMQEKDLHMERMPARMRAFKELSDIANIFLKIQQKAEDSGLQPQSSFQPVDFKHEVIFDTGYLISGRGRTMAEE